MGLFIDIEGLDGCGKTTQVELLSKRFDSENIKYKKIKLPDYDSESSVLVRKYLNGDFGKNPGDVNAFAASVLYTVDRFASYTEKWKAGYENNTLIFADRYTPANVIYQMTKLPRKEWDFYIDWLFDLEYKKVGIPEPDKVIFLDMPVDVSQKLMTSRYKGDESKKDVHEADVDFLNKCRSAALYAAEKCGWTVLPCSDGENPLPIDVISEKIYAAVLPLIKK